MILTEDIHSIRRKTCPNATLSITDSMCSGLVLNWVLLCERLATDCMSLDMAWTRHDWAVLSQIYFVALSVHSFAEGGSRSGF